MAALEPRPFGRLHDGRVAHRLGGPCSRLLVGRVERSRQEHARARGGVVLEPLGLDRLDQLARPERQPKGRRRRPVHRDEVARRGSGRRPPRAAGRRRSQRPAPRTPRAAPEGAGRAPARPAASAGRAPGGGGRARSPAPRAAASERIAESPFTYEHSKTIAAGRGALAASRKPAPDGPRKRAHCGRSYTIRRPWCRTRLPGATGRVGTLCAVPDLCRTTDVLVVGAGGAGLSAAWAARRSGVDVLHVTKGSKASCNTAKAQGGIQAAVGDDDSPEQHATDIVASSHDTADPALAGILAEEAPGAIAWLEELGVGFSREGDGYRLARCGGAIAPAAPPGGRPHRPCDRNGAAKGARRRGRSPSRPYGARRARADERPLRGRARAGRRARPRRRRRGRARGRRALLRRGPPGRHPDDEPARRDRRGHRARPRPGRRGARLRRPPAPPQRRRLAASAPGLLDPRDDPRVRRAPPERQRRAVRRRARAARHGRRRHRARVRRGPRPRDAGRPARGAPGHDPDRPRRRRPGDSVHAAPVPIERASTR